LIVREKGGIYLDSDYHILKDIEPIISKYDQIFTLERDWVSVANCFFGSIPYGPFINAILERVEFNLNLNNDRELEFPRDYPADPGSKTMMHIGPIAFTEAIYDKLRKSNDDCGEYVVMSFGVFSDHKFSWGS